MHPLLRQAVGFLGRVGTRAVAEAAASVAQDVDDAATKVSKKARRVKKKAREIPREVDDSEDE